MDLTDKSTIELEALKRDYIERGKRNFESLWDIAWYLGTPIVFPRRENEIHRLYKIQYGYKNVKQLWLYAGQSCPGRSYDNSHWLVRRAVWATVDGDLVHGTRVLSLAMVDASWENDLLVVPGQWIEEILGEHDHAQEAKAAYENEIAQSRRQALLMELLDGMDI